MILLVRNRTRFWNLVTLWESMNRRIKIKQKWCQTFHNQPLINRSWQAQQRPSWHSRHSFAQGRKGCCLESRHVLVKLKIWKESKIFMSPKERGMKVLKQHLTLLFAILAMILCCTCSLQFVSHRFLLVTSGRLDGLVCRYHSTREFFSKSWCGTVRGQTSTAFVPIESWP